MYIVFISAFQAGVALHKNCEASGDLARDLVRRGLTPEVSSSYQLHDYGYEHGQSFAVRVDNELDVRELAALAGQFQQSSILMVDVLENNRTYLIPTAEGSKREPLGYLKSSHDTPKGPFTQWRGKYWSIKNDDLLDLTNK